MHYNDIAQRYFDYFNILVNNPTKKQTKLEVQSILNELNKTDSNPKSYFSPVSNDHILEAAADLIRSAKSSVFISAPFGLNPILIDALNGNDKSIIEYGVGNTTARKKIETVNRKNTRMFVASRLETYMGKKWDAKAFGNHKVHTKCIVIDPWSDSPKVLFGSANFSKNSCRNNDENSFMLSNDSRMAAVMTTEFMRIYDHYKSRHFINKFFSDGPQKEHFLKEDTSWMKTAFSKNSRSHKFQDRLVFSGSV